MMVLTASRLIEKALKDQGVSRSELARRLGCTRQNVGQRLTRDSWSLESLSQIAKALDVPPERLIETRDEDL